MLVKELIEYLKELDENKEIYIDNKLSIGSIYEEDTGESYYILQ